MAIRKSNPFISLANSYVIDAPEPSNISYFWNFGSLLATCLIIQLATGIFLAMHYSSNLDLAFISVQHIMIDVNYGWLIRYAHANGAGFFFIFVYLHMARGIYYGSYRKPRIALWTIGVIIFLLMIITAFMGKHNSPKSFNNYKINLNNKRNFSSSSYLKEKKMHVQDLTNPKEVLKDILGNVKFEKYWENIHQEDVKEEIRAELKQKSGIYFIVNKITHNLYVGSAIKNKLFSRFMNHLNYHIGSKIVARSVKKYGLSNFIYGIFEYVEPNNSKLGYQTLWELETSYITLLSPKYNILPEAGTSLGYKHNEESIAKMKTAFSEERKELLRIYQANREWSEKQRNRLRIVALNRTKAHWPLDGRLKLSRNNGQTIYLYNTDNKLLCQFYSKLKACNYLCCSQKTIQRSINKGYIYIPNDFIKHLNDLDVSKYNSVKDKQSFTSKHKAGLLLTKNKTKFLISYKTL